ncbi:hypothetical protein [Actinophytocola sp.]|uniref:hypothetical protein n=1 Tax=Actinophytocola sp. TaxID=1872138 RepID=UPI003D6B384E
MVPSRGDERAVLAALRQVDACALLDARAARLSGFPTGSRPVALGPHRCDLRANDGARVSVRLGMSFTARDRLGDFYPRALGGAKAYVERWGNEPRSMCFLHLPVGRSLSVRFAVFAGTASTAGDLCAVAAAFGSVAARRLARPETLRPGADRPMASWDPCAVLGTALDDPYGYHLSHESVGDYGIDGCVADPMRPPVGAAIRLTLGYGRAHTGGVPKRIAGRRTVVSDAPRACTVQWSNGPAGTETEQLMELSAPDCPRAEQLVAAVLRAPTTGSRVVPRHGLLYRPDEPDLPVAGACGYYATDPARCQPYAAVAVPGRKAELVRAATTDIYVNCAIALDAVRERVGATLRPVVDDTVGCVFVEPTRTARVAVRLAPGRVRAEQNATWTSMAGLPVQIVEWVESPWHVRRLDVVLTYGGTLSVTAYASAKIGSTRDDPIDPARLDVADTVAEQITTTHLS